MIIASFSFFLFLSNSLSVSLFLSDVVYAGARVGTLVYMHADMCICIIYKYIITYVYIYIYIYMYICIYTMYIYTCIYSYRQEMVTGGMLCGSVCFVGHFPQKSPMIFCKRALNAFFAKKRLATWGILWVFATLYVCMHEDMD